MAASVTVNHKWVAGDRKEVAATVTFDSSYPTGGLAVTLAQLGFRNRVVGIFAGGARDASGNRYDIDWNGSATAPKLIASRTNAINGPQQEVPNATNLSTFSVNIVAIGK